MIPDTSKLVSDSRRNHPMASCRDMRQTHFQRVSPKDELSKNKRDLGRSSPFRHDLFNEARTRN